MQSGRNIYGHGAYTALKQAHVRAIFRKHLAIVETMARVRPRIDTYTYLELYAGHGGGTWQDEQRLDTLLSPLPYGSPILFLDEALDRTLPIRACFIEQDRRRSRALVDRICEHLGYGWDACVTREGHGARWDVDGHQVHVHQGDCVREAPAWLQVLVDDAARRGAWLRGLIFADPNGELAWQSMVDLVTICPFLDVLLYYSANMRKRVRCCGKTYVHDQLLDLLPLVQKQHWFVREPAGRKEWTFFFGSNMAGIDPIRRLGFWSTESERGRAIMRALNYTVKERAAMGIEGQLPLFGGGGD
jgi:hypothetical protein